MQMLTPTRPVRCFSLSLQHGMQSAEVNKLWAPSPAPAPTTHFQVEAEKEQAQAQEEEGFQKGLEKRLTMAPACCSDGLPSLWPTVAASSQLLFICCFCLLFFLFNLFVFGPRAAGSSLASSYCGKLSAFFEDATVPHLLCCCCCCLCCCCCVRAQGVSCSTIPVLSLTAS